MTSITHPLLPATGWFHHLAWRLSRVFETTARQSLDAELRRLPTHLLQDIGLDRNDFTPSLDELTTRADLLESRRALASYLATTTR
jgi:hypothetical protein